MRKIYTLIILSFITLQTHGMNLFVQTPDNGTISLDVEPSDSAENVKAKIFDQISVPVINQVLSWNGTTIQDNQTLADVGIVTNNSTIVLTVTNTTQVPEKMSYQAVVRNTTNNLVTNQPVGMQISILQGSATGTAVYVETQTPTSNANGLVSLEIGGGTVVSGNMATINWANGPYFIKTETDPTGGSSYTITGTSQLLSAPYALYAKTSGSSIPGPAGPMGPQGPAGTPGANGQGVPVGGTTGQVLAKVDGSDYNTQWVTPSASAAAYPNVELYVSNTSIQAIPDLLGGTSSTLLTFSATNNPNASLTGGNTWNGSVFTVGTAGWYEIDVQIVGVTNAGGLSSNGVDFFIDKNNTVGASKTGALYRNVRNSQPSETILKNNSTLHTRIFLNAGDNIRFRGLAWSNTIAANTSADGSTFLNIVRIK